MITAWYRRDDGAWVKVHVAGFLAGPNRGQPCVVMYYDSDKDKTLQCVSLHDDQEVSRFRAR